MSRITLGSDEVRRLNWFGLKPHVANLLGAPVINPALHAVARMALPDRLAHRLPLNQRSVAYRMNDGGSVLLLDPRHDTVARDIYWGGGKPLEPAERHKLTCIEHLSKESATFLDIGAYAGLYALIAARANPKLSAITFEIVPENHLLLMRNVIANDLVLQIEPRLCGIGAAQGTIQVPQSFGAASLMSSISLGSEFDSGVSVPITTLDQLSGRVTGPVLIKVDVEGFEDEVFRGGGAFMDEHRPDIICEILPGTYQSCAMIGELLGSLGYHLFCFEGTGAMRRERLTPQAQLRDWLLTTDPSGAGNAKTI